MASPCIDVYLKLSSGKAVSQQHLPHQTVRDIAKKIAETENLQTERVRLKYQGKTLDNSKSISYLGIRAETILKVEVLVPRDTHITLKLPDDKTESVLLQSTDTVQHLRQVVQEKSAIKKSEQVLKNNKVTISGDDNLLVDVGLQDGAVVTVLKVERPQTGDNNTDVLEEVDEDIKQDLLETFNSGGRNVEVVFCFDTTGSMYSCIQTVRSSLRGTCRRLMSEIPNIKIGIMANGDYCDNYVVRYVDLTTDVEDIVQFAETVPSTGGGGNGGEAYEWAMRKAQQLDWSEDSAKAFVLIGDEPPHHSGFTDQHVFWKDEVDVLAGMGIKVYGVQALMESGNRPFYQAIAQRSGGFYLQLKDFNLITDMFLAVCYRAAAEGNMDDFTDEFEKQGGNLTEDTKLFLDKLDEKQTPEPETSTAGTSQQEEQEEPECSAIWWTRQDDIDPQFSYNPDTDEFRDKDYSTTRPAYSPSTGLASLQYRAHPKKKSKLKKFLCFCGRG